MYPWPHLVIHTVYVKSSLDFEEKKYLFILQSPIIKIGILVLSYL